WAWRCANRPWRTVLVWVGLVVASMVTAAVLLSGALTTESTFTGTPDSKRADDLRESRLGVKVPIRDVVIVRAKGSGDQAGLEAMVSGVHDSVAELGPDVVSVAPVADAPVSEDGRSVLLALTIPGDIADAEPKIDEVIAAATGAGKPGYEVLVTGDATLSRDLTKLSESDLQKGEAIGIPIALVILVIVFGAVVAALIPVVLALFAIVIGIAMIALIGTVSPLSFFAVNMLTFMGLAVGIDYCLFVVSRFREERARGLAVEAAVVRSAGTAGRAVMFSGLTVVLALIGMLIVPTQIFISLAVGAIVVVLVTMMAALTLLPAVLRLLGDRINRGRIPLLTRGAREDSREGLWARAVHVVMERPALSAVIACSLLLLAAVPVLSINTGAAGVSSLPDSLSAKQGFVVLDRDFSAGAVTPADIVVDGAVGTAKVDDAIASLTGGLASDERFGAPTVESHPDQQLAVISVPVAGDSTSKAAEDAVKTLRNDAIPAAFEGSGAKVYVTGATAINLDFTAITKTYLPIVFALVLGLSFILLLVAFRSVVVPLTSIVMNLLSVGAAYGLLVFVTQMGHGAGLFGFQVEPTIEAWIPLFLFSVLFGLSMDYQVFLLSRIRERYDHSGNTREAVAYGIGSTAHLITGAALIMVAVFAGFASGDLVMFQQLGFGLGVAFLVDATIVRVVLMPAVMELLEDRNWYLPGWLEWLPNLSVEGEAEVAPRAAPEPAPTTAGS
ncbi:MAG: putative drug exporter of the superfamily, partial [Gaiellales bacterium]|nr:putative drug exporter of the superfamily [Gaiellales bacterium]